MKKPLVAFLAFLIALGAFNSGFIVFAEETIGAETIVLNENNTEISIAKDTFVYTGKEICPEVQVSFTGNGETVSLVKGTDYSVNCTQNVNPGTAQLSVDGINKYSGSLGLSFFIIPKKMAAPKAKSASYNSLTVSFAAHPGASGYQLSVTKKGSSKQKTYSIASDKTAYTVKSLLSDTKYTVKIRAFVNAGGKKMYGEYSKAANLLTGTAVAAPKISGYSDLNGKNTVKIEKVKKAGKYVIYRSNKKNGKYKQIGSTAKTSFTDKKVKLHKTYYYKVKAVRTISGKKYYSRLSSPLKLVSMKTVFVGDSVMQGVKEYRALPGGTFVTKIGMGTYTFYNSYYFDIKGEKATGIDKVISLKPERIFVMFGMNELHYRSNKQIIEYYEYAIEDIQDECPGVQIVILPVSPTSKNCGKTYPKKARLKEFNAQLQKMAKKYGCDYYDFTEPFKDSDGYLAKSCSDGDGVHWSPTACKLFVEQINKFIKK